MWWGIGIGAVLYVVLLVTLGVIVEEWTRLDVLLRNLLPTALDHWRVHATASPVRLSALDDRHTSNRGLRSRRPPNQHLARPLEPAPMDELGQRGRRRLRPSAREAGQAREHRVRLLEPDVRDLGAVAGVPAKRRPPEPSRGRRRGEGRARARPGG